LEKSISIKIFLLFGKPIQNIKTEVGGGGVRSENWWQRNTYSLNRDEGKHYRVKVIVCWSIIV
jgi:hypothetical protein